MLKLTSCVTATTRLLKFCGSHSLIPTACYGQNAVSCSVSSMLLSSSRSLNHNRYIHLLSPSLSSASDASVKQTISVNESERVLKLDRFHKVQELMCVQIPGLLSQRHEYRAYSSDVIFENNWNTDNPQRTVGIGSYVLAVVKARFFIHSKFAKAKVTVLSSEIDDVSGTVRVHWRFNYLPQAKAFMFWKYRPFKFSSTATQLSQSDEGVSTFYVNEKGFIYKHVLDKVKSSESTENEAAN